MSDTAPAADRLEDEMEKAKALSATLAKELELEEIRAKNRETADKINRLRDGGHPPDKAGANPFPFRVARRRVPGPMEVPPPWNPYPDTYPGFPPFKPIIWC